MSLNDQGRTRKNKREAFKESTKYSPVYEKQPSWWAETSIKGLHSIHIYLIK